MLQKKPKLMSENLVPIRKAAMGLLARREHAYRELTNKLVRRFNQWEDVDQVLQQLRSEGLQSDRRYTEAMVRYKAGQGQGPVRIRSILREAGINETLIADYLSVDEANWFEKAKQVRSKRFGSELPCEHKDKARQQRFLQYRGFTAEQTYQAMEECMVAEEY